MMDCIIVDDERIARRGMERLVRSDSRLVLSEMFADAESAARYLAGHRVDLVFLDIQMPGLSGIELARQISGQTLVVFTTAYSEYAVDSYEVDAVDYLVKPIDPARFTKAVDRAETCHRLLLSDMQPESGASAGTGCIIVKSDRRFVRVKTDDILFVEGLKDYVIIQLEGRRIVTRMTVKGMEELLPASGFIKVNRSYIANIDRIDAFDSNDVFIGDYEIAVSPLCRESVMARLMG